MKILLIYPQYTHSSEFDLRSPSLSLVYLASYLERGGHEVKIFDASLGPVKRTGKVFHYGIADDQMAAYLRTASFDLVGITCSFTSRWRFVAKIAQLVKDISPSAPVVVGGLFPTYSWRYCFENSPHTDVIILGEGEETFLSLADHLEKKLSLPGSCGALDGVAWRQGTEFFINPKTRYNNDLDELPFPAWHLMDIQRYFKFQRRIFDLPSDALPLLSSRSCPNRCRFCNMYVTQGERWRFRSAGNMLDEIEYLIKTFGVRNYYFVDDNFSMNLTRAKDICRGIIERGLRIKYNFHNGLSIKTIDEELVCLLKASGCISVCLAVESGSERIRNEVYGKKLPTEKIVNVFRWFRQAGIPSVAYFMVGAPSETYADIVETKKMIASLPMSLVAVSAYTPYPGTELYDECVDKGWLCETPVDDENRVEMFVPMLTTPDFKPADVLRWKREVYFSFLWHHWRDLLWEMLRPNGLVNMDAAGKFMGMLRFNPKENKQ